MKKIIALLIAFVFLAGCHDTEKTFYTSGELKCEFQYNKDTKIKDGVQKCFYKSGKLEKEEHYKDGKKDSVWKEWYVNGQLKEERTYKDDEERGTWKEWYESGKLAGEVVIHEGGIEEWKWWYENGQLESEGSSDGVWKTWYENGQLESECALKHGERDGAWKKWDAYGVLVDETSYKDGPKMPKDLAKEIDEVLRQVAGLQTTGKTNLGGFDEGYAEGGSGDGLAGLLGGGGGGIATKAKGSVKTPSEQDIDMGTGGRYRGAADVMTMVRRRTPGLRHIYNKFLKKKPGFQGEVVLKLVVAPSGEVISTFVESSSTGYDEFDADIKTAVSHWKFSRVKNGIVTVTIPFVFSENE